MRGEGESGNEVLTGLRPCNVTGPPSSARKATCAEAVPGGSE